MLICTGSGSADPVLKISDSDPDPVDPKRPDPTVSAADCIQYRYCTLGRFLAVQSAQISCCTVYSVQIVHQTPLFSSYYSPTGLEYNIGRINIGGCDFSDR